MTTDPFLYRVNLDLQFATGENSTDPTRMHDIAEQEIIKFTDKQLQRAQEMTSKQQQRDDFNASQHEQSQIKQNQRSVFFHEMLTQ